MELLTTTGGLVGALVALALVDSTSTGTLLLPAWMLLAPGPPPVRRVLLHLLVVAGCYALLGAGLLAGGLALVDALREQLRDAGRAPAVAQLVVGAGLFAASFALDSGRRRRRGLPDRTERWRRRVVRTSGRGGAGLAVAAVALEAATMLPYLAALGILGAARLAPATTATALAGYCLLMVAPAGALLLARVLAGERLQPLLRRVDAWARRPGDSALGWGAGIAGFLIARDAAGALLG